MTANRQKSAWIWVAVAAIAVATLARAESGLPKATAFTNPVLQFLSAHTGSEAFASLGLPGSHVRSYDRVAGATHGERPGAWTVVLPILFVGLIAPLSLISPQATLSLGRTPVAPALPCRFQRPPPSFSF